MDNNFVKTAFTREEDYEVNRTCNFNCDIIDLIREMPKADRLYHLGKYIAQLSNIKEVLIARRARKCLTCNCILNESTVAMGYLYNDYCNKCAFKDNIAPKDCCCNPPCKGSACTFP